MSQIPCSVTFITVSDSPQDDSQSQVQTLVYGFWDSLSHGINMGNCFGRKTARLVVHKIGALVLTLLFVNAVALDKSFNLFGPPNQ